MTDRQPPRTSAAAPSQAQRERWGLWLGLLGVALFALTLPMTRLATGSAHAPQLSPGFVTLGRGALAGLLSAGFLLLTRAPLPQRPHWRPLGLALLGNVLGYPLLLAWALREVTASHAAVVTALLPLATAVLAAWVLHQRASRRVWLCALLGRALVLAFALLREHQQAGHWRLTWADLWLLGAVLAGALGYVFGAQVTAALGAERVICWVCLLALPITLPAALWLWPTQPIAASAWGGFIYVGVFSMWAGFFAWYRGLAWGGTLRVSQLQLLQILFGHAGCGAAAGRTAGRPDLRFCRRGGRHGGCRTAPADPGTRLRLCCAHGPTPGPWHAAQRPLRPKNGASPQALIWR